MSFNLKKMRRWDLSKNLQKLLKPEFYELLGVRVGGTPRIDLLDKKFIPILIRWSLETAIHFCKEYGIFKALEGGNTVKELLFDLEWKNEAMMEDLLDALVDQKLLRKKNRSYLPLPIIQKLYSTDDLPWGHLASFESNTTSVSETSEFGLNTADRQWIEQESDYRPIFSFYHKLVSSSVMETMTTGHPTATLGPAPSPLTTIFDGLLKTPPYVIPRMAALAAGVTRHAPKTILDLNCSSGRGIDEILLYQPNAEFILGVDSNASLVELAKKNIEMLHETHAFQEESVAFQVIDYTHTLTDQLGEFGPFDMILINQLPMWFPKDVHEHLIQEIWNLLRPDGVIAMYQPLRPSLSSPWPDEWILRVLDGFFGFPDKSEFLKLFTRRPVGVATTASTSTQTIIPTLAYLIST